LASTKGVLSLPDAPEAFACRRASSIISSMTAVGIAASVGTGLANSNPDWI
jgi:hypothetical protein